MLAQWTAGSSVLCPPGSNRLLFSPELLFLGPPRDLLTAQEENTFFFLVGGRASSIFTNPVKLSLLASRYLGNDCPLCLSEIVK